RRAREREGAPATSRAEVADASREAIRPRPQEAAQGPRAGEGLLGAQEQELPVREGAGRALARLRLSRPQGQEADVPPALDHPHQRRCPAARSLVQPVHRGPEDRKSTRLNSSHVAISYAVFCLKKKTKYIALIKSTRTYVQ